MPESLQIAFPTSLPTDLRTLTFVDTGSDPNIDPDPGFVSAPAAVCYCAGTTVTTPRGLVDVEDIQAGDLIVTQDNGAQPVRWVGHRVLNADELSANPKLRPVRIVQGALGNGFPQRDLCVSRQHRVLLRSQVATCMFGTEEVLIPAVHLCALPGIFVDETTTSLTYVHILFDQHEIIFAEGTPAESLYLGPNALEALSPEAQEEIQTIFPEVSRNNTPDLVRIVPERQERKTRIDQHMSDQEARSPTENVLN